MSEHVAANYKSGCRCADCTSRKVAADRKWRRARGGRSGVGLEPIFCAGCYHLFDPRGFYRHENACLPKVAA
jgi:hypothetical protein